MKNKDNLDELMENIDLTEKTELQGVADEMFTAGTTRTKISPDEVGATFVTGIVFKALGMGELDPTNRFLELKKSEDGFSTEKFVQAVGGQMEQRSGSGFFNRIKGALMPPDK